MAPDESVFPLRLADLLRTYRERALLTQEQLARLSGISARTIRRLEHGAVKGPQPATLRLLALHLHLSSRETYGLVEAGEHLGAGSGTTRTPTWLPSDLADFTGRQDMADRIVDALLSSKLGQADSTSGRMVQISGPAGVGKTALAIHVAHRLHPEFRAGCLYLDLRGRQDQPLLGAEAVTRLLRWCLGGDRVLPSDLEDRSALLRATLTGRGYLLVLDNVDSEAQVRPVLSAAAGTTVLLTGRRTLAAIDNLRHHDLGFFDLEEAVGLLRSVLGPERVEAEPGSAVRIAELCGRVPLAVRLAAARLVVRPHWRLERLVEQLADEHRRLDALAVGDRAVRASIELSHRSLSPSARTLFSLLGAVSDTDLPGWVAGPLLDLPRADAAEALEELVEVRLVEVDNGGRTRSPRFSMHSLVRLYARDGPPLDEKVLRGAAERFIGSWLFLAELESDHLAGGPRRFASGDGLRFDVTAHVAQEAATDPRSWFEAEQQSVAGAIQTAGRLGFDEQMWDLVGCLGRYLEVVGDLDRWERLLRFALVGVRRSRNRRGEAYLLRSLAELLLDRDEYPAAREYLQAASRALLEIGDVDAVADVDRALGYLERMLGDLAAAGVRLEAAVRYFESGDDLVGRAEAYFSLGLLRHDQGKPSEALRCYDEALALEERLRNRVNQALLRCSIGSALLMEDRVHEAQTALTRVLSEAEDAEHCEAFARAFLGAAETRTGALEAADQRLADALRGFRRLSDRHGEALVLRNLAELRRVQGRTGEAYRCVRESLRLWADINAPVQHTRSLVTFGRVQLSAGEADGALATWDRADAEFRRLGSRERVPISFRAGQERPTGHSPDISGAGLDPPESGG